MKALYTDAPGSYSLVTRPDPRPAPDEVIVRVGAVGFCANDLRIRAGVLRCPYPMIPGHQFAGTVVERGTAVKYAAVGDRVAIHSYVLCGQCEGCRAGRVHECANFQTLGLSRDGGLAEYCAVPERCLYKLPASVTLEEGSLLENLSSAAAICRVADLGIAERVVILGATPVGLQALQVAKLYSPEALVLAGTGERRLELARSLGATHVADLDAPNVASQVAEMFGGRGASVVLMCDWTGASTELALRLAGPSGRVVIESHVPENLEIRLAAFEVLIARSVALRANQGWTTADYTLGYDLLREGKIKVAPLITHRFPLREWETAFEAFVDRDADAVQVVLTPEDTR
ncbi:MAG TPA: alcohol dehydrogenase catalytic domain-containing protein [Bauldia sp.]|nr:alcohol dehydrogenase catalytic domain-containing protein [Bauldia sp.]